MRLMFMKAVAATALVASSIPAAAQVARAEAPIEASNDLAGERSQVFVPVVLIFLGILAAFWLNELLEDDEPDFPVSP